MNKLQPLALLLALWSCHPRQTHVLLQPAESSTSALIQAISQVDDQTAWVSGHHATFGRTADAGGHWEMFTYDSIDSLQFRDIHAFSADDVVLMSAGPGAMSRIFLFNTKSGFRETYVMPYEKGFLNTIEFWDLQNGIAFGDSFDGELFALRTQDGGLSWTRIDPKNMPPAGNGEGGFAASGSCISLQPEGKAWIATGAGGNSRILYSEDYGKSWSGSDLPTVKGEAAGIMAIHMANAYTGLISGGDLNQADAYTENMAITIDGGKNWVLTKQPVTKGAFYGSTIIPWKGSYFLMACGPNGLDYSTDMGNTFINADTLNYWAVDLNPHGSGYATGKDGRIVRIQLVEE